MPDNPDPDEVDKIIAEFDDKQWTYIPCGECQEEVKQTVFIGDHDEDGGVFICESCLETALNLIKQRS